MNVDVVVGLLCISVILIVISVAGFKCKIDCDIDYLKNMVTYLNRFYHNLDKRCGDMFDIMKGQQEEIKILKELIEQPEEKKKSCCGNCRFYYELNNQSSACLNVNVNNRHKSETTLYADNRSVSCGTIKRVKPNECCEWYKPKEDSNEW